MLDYQPDSNLPTPESTEPQLFEDIVDSSVAAYIDAIASEESGLVHFKPEYATRYDQLARQHLMGVFVVGKHGPLFEPKSYNFGSLLGMLGDHATNIDQIFYLFDKTSSQEVADLRESIIPKYDLSSFTASIGSARVYISGLWAKFALSSDEIMNQSIDTIFEKLSTQEDGDSTRKMITFFEGALKKVIVPDQRHNPQDKPTKEMVERVIRWTWAMEEADFLQDEHSARSIVGSPAALQIPGFAEILTHRLTKKPAESKAKQEQASINLAKMVLKDLLSRYAKDPTRHTQNVSSILKAVFPNQNRPDSMSRKSLIEIANHVIASDNTQKSEGDQDPMLSSDMSGVTSTAVEKVLSITTAHTISSDAYEQHRLEDKLYANLIGMLLEHRSYGTQ